MAAFFYRWRFLFILCVFFACNILFNWILWKQIIFPEHQTQLLLQGESFIYEYFAEAIRENILSGRNPFARIDDIFYPFGWDFVVDDVAPINGLYFLFLRPFLTQHQSFMLITVLSIFFANISMYALLRRLKISYISAILFSLAFGFMPFISVRIGAHETYAAVYVFPLLSYSLLSLVIAKDYGKKRWFMILLGLSATLTFYTNFYYTVMVLIAVPLGLVVLFPFFKKSMSIALKANAPFLFGAGIISCVLLLPWVVEARTYFLIHSFTKPSSLHDVLYHSADITSIFIPSLLNPFYRPILVPLSQMYPRFIKLFENFIYPGILILATYPLSFLLWKKFSQKEKQNILSPLILGFIFWVFTLGPFLHILKRQLPIPLPYSFISALPVFQLVRAPGRFAPLIVFWAAIAGAFLVDYMLKRKKKAMQMYFYVGLFLLFFLDQFYQVTIPPIYDIKIPHTIYQHLASQETGPILEIPFTIRDGLKNFGNFYAVWLTRLQRLHRKQTFGIYGGRIEDAHFEYFKRDPLLRSFALLVDKDATDAAIISKQFNLTDMQTSLDFFNVEYSVLNQNERYSNVAMDMLTTLQFTKVLDDGDYILLKRPITELIDPIDIGSAKSFRYLVNNWSDVESNGRWVLGKSARILFRVTNPQRPYIMQISSETFSSAQLMKLFVNQKEVETVPIPKQKTEQTVVFEKNLREGINILDMQFTDTFIPSQVLPNSTDSRELSVFFRELSIKESSPAATFLL